MSSIIMVLIVRTMRGGMKYDTVSPYMESIAQSRSSKCITFTFFIVEKTTAGVVTRNRRRRIRILLKQLLQKYTPLVPPMFFHTISQGSFA